MFSPLKKKTLVWQFILMLLPLSALSEIKVHIDYQTDIHKAPLNILQDNLNPQQYTIINDRDLANYNIKIQHQFTSKDLYYHNKSANKILSRIAYTKIDIVDLQHPRTCTIQLKNQQVYPLNHAKITDYDVSNYKIYGNLANKALTDLSHRLNNGLLEKCQWRTTAQKNKKQ